MRKPNYDKYPCVDVPGGEGCCISGWEACLDRLRQAIARQGASKTVLVVECYPGVEERAVFDLLNHGLTPDLSVFAADAMLPPMQVDALVNPFLGGDDPVFGFLCGLTLPQFFDAGRVEALHNRVQSVSSGLVLIVGCGASLIAQADILVYADMPRWEGQNRFRRDEASNLGVENRAVSANLQYKRAFFVDWRVADRLKRQLMSRWDFVLDTTVTRQPRLADGNAVRRGLAHAVTRPFRVVPFFDPAPWGGEWMRQVCGLASDKPNYGWCFDCVPEENSLLLRFGTEQLEIPSINLVFAHPQALLGESIHARFGDEFPIRFDFLDTMGGGNLSFQVHPLTEYIQHHFGMHYTQDESYYMLATGPNAGVYLGLRENIDRAAMARDLQQAQAGGVPFAAERYANFWPAKTHDHFLIPAGTVHCSGRDSMVLEISATPYIFTFKLWDWGRLGLDGKPRPIHLQHGLPNIQWERTTSWVEKNLINRVEPLGASEGWREERTGLHEREFIETRRHWFTDATPHHTRGGLNVLNLVQGEEALVESPEGLFEPFPVHYAETFIVPAQVGPYNIRPAKRGENCATIKAFVRAGAALPGNHVSRAEAAKGFRPPIAERLQSI